MHSDEERQLQLALEASLMPNSFSPQEGSSVTDATTASGAALSTQDQQLELALKLSQLELEEADKRLRREEELEQREQEELERILALSLTDK